MKPVAVVASAGAGKRLNKKIAKPLVNLNGKPILIHTLENLSKSGLIQEIVVAVNRANLNIIRKKIRQFGLKKVKKVVSGGKTRAKSVLNGIMAVKEDCDLVVIHDGARPFVSKALINKAIEVAGKFGAAIVAVPVKSTIKKIDSQKSEIISTINRNSLWEAQTPQVFKKDLILDAYKKIRNFNLTDEAAMLEKLGKKVKLVLGSYENIKITTPEDLKFAEIIAKGFKNG